MNKNRRQDCGATYAKTVFADNFNYWGCNIKTLFMSSRPNVLVRIKEDASNLATVAVKEDMAFL